MHETIYLTFKFWCKSTKFFRNPRTIIVQTVTKMIQCTLYVKK